MRGVPPTIPLREAYMRGVSLPTIPLREAYMRGLHSRIPLREAYMRGLHPRDTLLGGIYERFTP